MNKYGIAIEIPEGKLTEILDRLTAAQEEISKCYEELRNLGVVTIREKIVSGN